MAEARVIWTEKARQDLCEIVRALRPYSPRVAQRTSEQIMASTRRLAEFPSSGQIVPELPDSDFREVIVDNYHVVYESTGDTVEILSVLHNRRLMPGAR